MPRYDFVCEACGAEFEAIAPVGETPACPECASPETRKRFTPFAGPFTVRPRGIAARRADAERRVREEQRTERKEVRRQARETGGG